MKGAAFGGWVKQKGLAFCTFSRYNYTERTTKNLLCIGNGKRNANEIQKNKIKNFLIIKQWKTIHKGKRKTKTMGNNKQSHHPQNFLVVLSDNKSARIRALVNARNGFDALRVAINRARRSFGDSYNITRVRVAGVFPAGKKRIGKRIGVNMDFDQ